MKLTKLLASAAVATALGAAGTTAASALELKFGHVGAPGSLFEDTVNNFAACANEGLGDKGQVVTFGSSQLGKDKELMQKLKLGQVDFALPSSVMSSVEDTFGVFEMPYIIKDREHMRRVWDEMGDTFREAAASKGYRIVGVMENGFRHITNNVRPIDKPEDLQGIKLRTPSGAWRVKMFSLYGANPSPMAFSEVFTALQTGVMDGQENPYAQIASAKFQEVQKYLSITGHVYTPAYIMASEKHFAKLPDDVQAVLNDCGVKAQDYAYETAARFETELLQVIRDAGVEINEADKDAFIAASKPVYDEFAASVDGGGALIEKVQALGAGS